MQEETEVLGENLRGQVWIENQIHIRLIWPDWKSNPGLIGERLGNNRCANPLTQINTHCYFFVSPELSSKRDYVITHCVRSMYVVCRMYVVCMYMCVLFCKIDHCIQIHWCIPMGLGHKDRWVASHMWPQQTWGQRSSRGPWPLVQVFEKRSLYSQRWHIFMEIG